MAQNKNSFVIYCDLIHTVSKLDNENAGLLFKHILNYVNDLNPEPPNFIVEITFEQIKQQLKRDLKKYETIKEIKSESGQIGNLKRWNLDLYDKVIKNELELKDALNIAKSRKTSQNIANVAVNVSVNDNVSVSDSDNVSDNVKVKEKKKKYLNNILLFPIEFEKLVNEFGEEKTTEAINFLSEYKIEKGYTTKSDYLTLKRWVIEAVTKKQNNNLKNLNNATTTENPNDRRSGVERLNKLAGEFLQNNPNIFTLRNPES